MPAKNEIKVYSENSYYHLYNRGVEKRIVFLDEIDYSVFLSYLKSYLLPKNEKELMRKLADSDLNYKERDRIIKLLHLNNFSDNLTLVAYCLMPNHFHFLVHQKLSNTIDIFMNSLGTRYSMYFNKKYKRVGPLFQGNYKAVLIDSDEQLLYLSSYIHYQAQFFQRKPLHVPHPSSYPNYLGKISQKWVKPATILSFFNTAQKSSLKDVLSYQSFVEGYRQTDEEVIINSLLD